MSFKKWRNIESVSTKNRPILISIAQFHYQSRRDPAWLNYLDFIRMIQLKWPSTTMQGAQCVMLLVI